MVAFSAPAANAHSSSLRIPIIDYLSRGTLTTRHPIPRCVIGFVLGALVFQTVVPYAVAGQVPHYDVVLTHRIGGVADHEAALTIIPPTGLALGEHARIAVAQPMSSQVIVFSPTGQRVASYGRSGEGPGEFRAISMIGWRADTLWVADGRLFRITMFPPNDAPPVVYTLSDRAQLDTAMTVPQPLISSLSGHHWLSTRRTLTSNGQIRGRELLVLGSNSKRVLLASLEPAWRDFTVSFPDGGRVAVGYYPFSTHPLFRVSPAGAHITVVRRPAPVRPLAAYTVTRITPLGDTVFHVVYERTVPRTSKELRIALIERYASHPAFQRQARSAAALRKTLEEALDLPTYHSTISTMAVGTDDRTWLRGPDEWQKTIAWEVLDPQGRLERIVHMDRKLEIVAAGSTYVWGVIEDELNIPSLVRLQLVQRTRTRQ